MNITNGIAKKVLNIEADKFDEIKKYCDEHALNMPKTVAKIVIEKFNEDPNKQKLYNNFARTNW